MKYTIFNFIFLGLLCQACKNTYSYTSQSSNYKGVNIDTSFLRHSPANYVKGFQNGNLLLGNTSFTRSEDGNNGSVIKLIMPYDKKEDKAIILGFTLKKIENQIISGERLSELFFGNYIGCYTVSYIPNPKKDSTGFVFIHIDKKRNLVQGCINATFWRETPKEIEKAGSKLPDSVIVKNLKFSTSIK